MPTLSIIVPVYNVEAYIKRCLNSILAQTFTDFELILVDDGSPDGCPAICDEYAARDRRITVIHKPNGGLSDARNAGLDIAAGEFLGFVDSDDYISPNMYEKLVEAIKSSGADLVACGMYYIGADEKVNSIWPSLSENKLYMRTDFIDHFYPDVRRDIMPAVMNKLYKRTIFSELRFPIGKLYEDAFIQLDLFDQCNSIYVLHEHLYYYYYNRNGSILNSSFSEKRFSLVEFAYLHYKFFAERNIKEQIDYTLLAYLSNYLMNYFAVKLIRPELNEKFQPYKKQFHTIKAKLLLDPYICKMKKLVILIFEPCPHLAYRLCRKYFPECLYEDMR